MPVLLQRLHTYVRMNGVCVCVLVLGMCVSLAKRCNVACRSAIKCSLIAFYALLIRARVCEGVCECVCVCVRMCVNAFSAALFVTR